MVAVIAADRRSRYAGLLQRVGGGDRRFIGSKYGDDMFLHVWANLRLGAGRLFILTRSDKPAIQGQVAFTLAFLATGCRGATLLKRGPTRTPPHRLHAMPRKAAKAPLDHIANHKMLQASAAPGNTRL